MRIEHIDEVLPHVQGRSDFVVAQREGYTVIDYVYAAEDTFDHPIRIECRGIKFGPDGRVLARPFGKFFNINEKAHTQSHLIDLSQPHLIMEKLDGSMIHPAIVGGNVVLMTRMGHTDVAKRAEILLTDELRAFCSGALEAGVTPIFEYTAPTNRIIIKYDKPQLHLLALRETISGAYRDYATVRANALRHGIDVVPHVPTAWQTTAEFVEFARLLQGKEGFVIRFDNGLWLKMKGDDYVLKHKSKDQISLEKNALALILTGGTDDVMPLLTDEDRAELETYKSAVHAGVATTAAHLDALVHTGAHLDQKAFAVEHVRDVSQQLRGLVFLVRKGKPATEAVRDLILKHTNTQTQVDEVRGLFNAQWTM